MQPTYFDIKTNTVRNYESATTKLAFDFEPTRVKVSDEPPATIAARRAAGELVVSRTEIAAMLVDEPELRIERVQILAANLVAYQRGLAHESAPAEPSRPMIPATTREIMADRGIALGELLDDTARFTIETEIKGWEAERNLRYPLLAAQRSQLCTFAIAGTLSDKARWIRHALSDPDELPIRTDSVFGPAPWLSAKLPPVFGRVWARNDAASATLTRLVNFLGVSMPPPWTDTTLVERERAIQQHRATLENARFAEDDRARIQGEADRRLEETIAELAERNSLAGRAWSDAVDRCRRRVIASIDHAIENVRPTTRAIVRLALFELAHELRELPSITGMAPAIALEIALGGSALVRVLDTDVPALPAKSITLSVAVRHPNKRRRRAGVDFTDVARAVDVDEREAKLIEDDDGLISYRVPPSAQSEKENDLRATAGSLDALRAENERLRAEHAARKREEREEKLGALEKAFADALADTNPKRREKRVAELHAELEKVKAELGSPMSNTRDTTPITDTES